MRSVASISLATDDWAGEGGIASAFWFVCGGVNVKSSPSVIGDVAGGGAEATSLFSEGCGGVGLVKYTIATITDNVSVTESVTLFPEAFMELI